jgi:hypothetical protein
MRTVNRGRSWPGLDSQDPFDEHINRWAVTGRERDVNIEKIASGPRYWMTSSFETNNVTAGTGAGPPSLAAPEAGDRLRGPTSAVEIGSDTCPPR